MIEEDDESTERFIKERESDCIEGLPSEDFISYTNKTGGLAM